ncbi:amidohydrolase [Pedobacter sp. FW305-3-2-15-E-R2A2]|uniref:amidohydrolase n=1 Tax=Pedobacter sp. FW305-3-2-15-E-R2A2 TaxID=3140251 RepID=UPI0031405C6C
MKNLNYGITLLSVVLLLTGCHKREEKADLIVFNAKIATMVQAGQFEEAVAIKDGIIVGLGNSKNILEKYASGQTQKIDAAGRTVIPGLNDSHIHLIREGLNYNAELRWDGVKTLKRAMELLKEQAKRSPDGVWIKVVGGWNEFQFEEKRQPTIAEINQAVPDKPVFISYLYGKAFVNKKGLEVLKYDKNTRYEGSLVELDKNGIPTGLLFAKETPKAIYTTLSLTTKLNHAERLNSTLQFYRELNRFGITSAIDAAGGGQNYDQDYAVALELAKNGKLNVRTSYYLFAQQRGKEFLDYEKWIKAAKPNKNDHMLVPNGYSLEGAGENLVASAADFENFLEPRTILSDDMEKDLEPVIRLLVKNKWTFRLHATYGESIERMLAVFEKVNKDTPFAGLRWCFDHAETITPAQIARVKKLGGGIAVQFRMYFQGELYKKMYGEPQKQLPPIKEMLRQGVPVGMGTDATRISTYNPWMAIHWLITGKTIGGMQFWPQDQVLDKFTALQLYTKGSAWFSGEEHLKGLIKEGQYADMAILSQDYFKESPENIRKIESLVTIVNGKVVYAKDKFKANDPGIAAVIPAWSPVKFYGGYQN